ncbi:MAG: twin-arginine translocase TatA/TatE family subunit, partial [Kiritimatiellia bacterium]
MSFVETLIILIVAMIVVGPKRMPEMARKIGKWMGVLRRAGDEFKRQLMTMDQAAESQFSAAESQLDQL